MFNDGGRGRLFEGFVVEEDAGVEYEEEVAGVEGKLKDNVDARHEFGLGLGLGVVVQLRYAGCIGIDTIFIRLLSFGEGFCCSEGCSCRCCCTCCCGGAASHCMSCRALAFVFVFAFAACTVSFCIICCAANCGA